MIAGDIQTGRVLRPSFAPHLCFTYELIKINLLTRSLRVQAFMQIWQFLSSYLAGFAYRN
jgi:hypothetical protein